VNDDPAKFQALAIHGRDNVAVALEDIAPGTPIRVAREGRVETLAAAEAIPLGHKLALRALAPGEAVVKYGEVIGVAREAIAPGAHVHVHNIASQRARSP
jgi:altronate dehydratase